MRTDAQPTPTLPNPRAPRRLAAWAVLVAVTVLSAAGPARAQERPADRRPAAAAAPAAPVPAGSSPTMVNTSSANAGARIPAATPPTGYPPVTYPPVTYPPGAYPPAAAFAPPAQGTGTTGALTGGTLGTAGPAAAADGASGFTAGGFAPAGGPSAIPGLPQMPDLSNRQTVSSAMQLIVLLTVLSLAPALLLMMTSFTRIVIVLSLLRQAMGTQSLPPNQVMIGLAMFMTFLVMGPTWSQVNEKALKPYMESQKKADGSVFDQQDALREAEKPVRSFMIAQVEKSGNVPDVDLFMRQAGKPQAKTWDDVSTTALIPAFMLSELKTAFLMGFKIYLPFLIIDMVISTVLISMGMMMLPPAMISLPFKLLLFVLVNGWHLIVENLMGSFAV